MVNIDQVERDYNEQIDPDKYYVPGDLVQWIPALIAEIRCLRTRQTDSARSQEPHSLDQRLSVLAQALDCANYDEALRRAKTNTAWAAGWSARVEGKSLQDNPFSYTGEYELWDAWGSGWGINECVEIANNTRFGLPSQDDGQPGQSEKEGKKG